MQFTIIAPRRDASKVRKSCEERQDQVIKALMEDAVAGYPGAIDHKSLNCNKK